MLDNYVVSIDLNMHSNPKSITVRDNYMNTTFSGKPCPPFKIVILDEADSMTGAAQVRDASLC